MTDQQPEPQGSNPPPEYFALTKQGHFPEAHALLRKLGIEAPPENNRPAGEGDAAELDDVKLLEAAETGEQIIRAVGRIAGLKDQAIPTATDLHNWLAELTAGEMNENILSQLQFQYDGGLHVWLPIRVGVRLPDDSVLLDPPANGDFELRDEDFKLNIELYRCLESGESEQPENGPVHERPFPIVMGIWVQTRQPGERRILPVAPMGPISRVHERWLALPKGERPAHPLVELVKACREQPKEMAAALVTAANRSFTRRTITFTTVARGNWQDDDVVPERIVDSRTLATIVDGEALATRLPDLAARLARQQKQRQRRMYKPGEQMPLKLPGVPGIPADLRLVGLAGMPPVLANDVLTILQVAHVVDWPGVILEDWQGASMLARTRDGGYRRPQPSDIERYRAVLVEIPGPVWFKNGHGIWDWRELASVNTQRDGRRRLSPPEWMQGGPGEQWTLSAAGGQAARERARLEADGSPAGRIVTGIEYRLAARYDGRRGIAPDLRPTKPGGHGPVVFLAWDELLHHGGIAWDRSSPKAEHAALMQYHRVVDRLRSSGYKLENLNAEAQAGDAIEVVEIKRGGNGRRAGLQVRATSRFVEAARLANEKDGRGFESMRLADWLGLKFQQPRNRA